jgi:hypothetical protein
MDQDVLTNAINGSGLLAALNFTSAAGSGTAVSTSTSNGQATVTLSNDYVDAASFNTSSGDVTLTRTGGLNPISFNIDGRYSTSVTYSGTIASAATWTDQTGYFTTAITVNGILATDDPIVDLNLTSATVGNIADIQTEWGKIYRVVTTENTVTFYALEAPAFPEDVVVSLQVVR